MIVDTLRYPIGTFTAPKAIDAQQRALWIDEMEETPAELRGSVSGLSNEQLDTPYRPEGWTIRQLVHHVPDSHVNGYIRFKWALTEDSPLIKPYDQNGWATTADSHKAPIEPSLALLDSMHARWISLLRAMSDTEYARSFQHPDHKQPISLAWALGNYSWHGRHHIAQIVALRRRKGW